MEHRNQIDIAAEKLALLVQQLAIKFGNWLQLDLAHSTNEFTNQVEFSLHTLLKKFNEFTVR